MTGIIIGLMGNGRVGKDTFADHISQKYRFTRIGLADPLKRFCKEVFDFSDEQLYGDKRDAPDRRYETGQAPHDWVYGLTRDHGAWDLKHPHMYHCRRCGMVGEGYADAPPPKSVLSPNECQTYLTPRFALQTLGTEWGRRCYDNIWIDNGIRSAKALIEGYAAYSAEGGLIYTEKDVGEIGGAVFSDLRFQNEFDAVKNAGGIIIRIRRPGFDGTELAGVKGHASEEEQRSIPDSAFDYVINNDSTIENYHTTIDTVMRAIRPVWPWESQV